MLRTMSLGLAASMFFAVTFVLNRAMENGGGSWMWSASLRYLFMLPILLLVVGKADRLGLATQIRKAPLPWLLWSTVGFGLFYAPLCLAATMGPSWLVAGTWQVTIVAGALLSPLFHDTRHTEAGQLRVRRRIPFRVLAVSSVILAGVFLLQAGEMKGAGSEAVLAGAGWILVAAFAYPLGNRKMMAGAGHAMSARQRVLGMTLCSLPFWLVLAIAALVLEGPPSAGQAGQSLVVAVSSGVVATLLFFKATDRAKHDSAQLAVVESTQAGEVVFALIGGIVLLGDGIPSLLGAFGLVLVIAGMVGNGLALRAKA